MRILYICLLYIEVHTYICIYFLLFMRDSKQIVQYSYTKINITKINIYKKYFANYIRR